jgi:hypothetical protein
LAHYTLHLEVAAAAEEHRNFIPGVRVAAVRESPDTMTTSAFAVADIYARASGYIAQRNVDIGSRRRASSSR